jgi:hypothetical protein
VVRTLLLHRSGCGFQSIHWNLNGHFVIDEQLWTVVCLSVCLFVLCVIVYRKWRCTRERYARTYHRQNTSITISRQNFGSCLMVIHRSVYYIILPIPQIYHEVKFISWQPPQNSIDMALETNEFYFITSEARGCEVISCDSDVWNAHREPVAIKLLCYGQYVARISFKGSVVKNKLPQTILCSVTYVLKSFCCWHEYWFVS